MDIFERLKAPFDPKVISWRVGSTNGDKTKGLALAYIDARDVMNRLDEVVGPERWQDRYEVHGSKTICYLSVLTVDGLWVTKADAAGDSDVEAEKGAISDAFKRAAVKWGIGRYLYDLESPWVELEAAGRSYRIKKSEYAKLEKLLGGSFKQPIEAADEPVQPAPKRDDPKQDTLTACFAEVALEDIARCASANNLAMMWAQMPPNVRAIPEVIAAKDARKKEFGL